MLQVMYPELDDLLEMIGVAGQHLAEIEAGQGAAGIISVWVRCPIDVRTYFPVVEEVKLPQVMPELAKATFIVSDSSRPLRETKDEPVTHLACLVVNDGGETANLYTKHPYRFHQLSTEFILNLVILDDQIRATNAKFHGIIYIQPKWQTYLSYFFLYWDLQYLNTHLLRWRSEPNVNLPEGIGIIPPYPSNSPELISSSAEEIREICKAFNVEQNFF